MRFFVFGCSLFAVAGAFAAVPKSPDDWYTPQGGFSDKTYKATWTDKYDNTCGATINDDGSIVWHKKPSDLNVKNALEFALTAYQQANENNEAILALGENLHNLGLANGLRITGQTPNGRRFTLSLPFTNGDSLTNSGGDALDLLDESGFFSYNMTDGKSLQWTKNERAQIYGWDTASPSTAYTLAEILGGGEKGVGGGRYDDYVLTRPADGGFPNYVQIGKILAGGCGCTNAWTTLLQWIEDGEMTALDGITFTDESLAEYLKTKGFIYSTTPDDFHFNNDDDGITASFDAPVNWWDSYSIDISEGGTVQLKGWEYGEGIGTTLASMLSADDDGGAGTGDDYLLVAQNLVDGSMAYIPVGSGIGGGSAYVDDVTITTNAANGAEADGKLSIAGWSQAEDLSVPMRTGETLDWVKVAPEGDGKSIVSTEAGENTDPKTTLKGFDAAGVGALAVKGQDSLAWKQLSAGWGMRIDETDGSFTIASTIDNPDAVGAFTTISFISDIRWDEQTRQLIATKTTVSAQIMNDAVQSEKVIFTATSHAEEHQDEQ